MIVAIPLFSRYLYSYYYLYSFRNPEAWEDGVKELAGYLEPIKSNYQKIYVTEQYDQPYILFLFYTKYPPAKFQKQAVLTPRDRFGFSTIRDLDNYHFDFIDWDKLKREENVLICGTIKEIPENAKIIKEIKFRNGSIAYRCAVP